MTATSFRDMEQLSAYLDGEISQADRARLEARISRDRDLTVALDDLRAARALLHRTPRRRVPRNFTLTPKMAGLRPPVPRLVPGLSFASAAAAVLLLFTFAGSLIGPTALGASAPAPQMAPAFAYGGGVGGGPAEASTSESLDKTILTEATPTAGGKVPPPSALMVAETPAPGVRTTEESTATLQVNAMEQPTPMSELLMSEKPLPTSSVVVPEVPPAERATKPPFRLTPLQIGLLALATVLGSAALVLGWRANRAFTKRVKGSK